MTYPKVVDDSKVGTYPAFAKVGGGYLWDEVLEYRVWCHPENGAIDCEEGSDYYYAFSSFIEAERFSLENKGCEDPLALILQKEHLNEIIPGELIHVKEIRIAEWPVEFLSRPRRDDETIKKIFSLDSYEEKLLFIREGKLNHR